MPAIARDPRSNTSSGKAKLAPDVKANGIAQVARAMTRAEKPQGTSTGRPIRFEIEAGNHAKTIDHDAAPR